jgi:hypothetical protein
MRRLTDKELVFVTEYLRSGNALASYRVAYPHASDATCTSESCKILRRPAVVDYFKEHSIDPDPAKNQPIIEWQAPTAEKILSVVESILSDPHCKPSDRLKAAELAGRYRALWTDRQLVDSRAQVTIVDDIDRDA